MFNAARHLAEAVGSIHRQAHRNLDIVVVDDGSTDGTAEVAAGLPAARYLRQERGGPASARNRGILAATGELLAFLDADDRWAEGKLAAQLARLEAEPAVDLVAGRVEEFYDDGTPASRSRVQRRSGDRAYTIGALLVRREVFLKVGLFDPQLRFGEFMDWRSRALAMGLKEQVLDRVVLHRRIHRENTTRLARNPHGHYLAAIRAHLARRRAADPGHPGLAP